MSSIPEEASRPKVVMVVTNFITGDSRVQKIARSAAANGWDVTLVGRSKSGRREESTLGAAKVIKVPVRATAQSFRRSNPPRGVVGLLGYRSAEQAKFRREEIRARREDLEVEQRLLRQHGGVLRKTRVAGLKMSLKAQGYWVELRRRLHERNARRATYGAGVRGLRARLVTSFGHDAGAWRTQPVLTDYETAFGPVLDQLRPDLIHAHDVDTLALAVRAKLRAEKAGRTVKVIYDSHEYVAGVERPDPTWRPAMLAHERKHIALVDGVMTVTDPLADLLAERYRLKSRPVVVKNAPERELADGLDPTPPSDIRADCGLDPDVPLLVYSGAVAPVRGLDTVVAALPRLPGVHFAVQVASRHQYVIALEEQAERLGVRDRLHVVSYVEPHQVVDYVRAATVGVIPLLHAPSAEIAICTKFFEFMHARLPIVMSDVKLQAEMVRELGNGEVFTAGDAASCAEAVRAVLADRDRYVKTYDTPGVLEANSWEAQVPILMDFYAKVTGLTPPRKG